jgi:hypothetical protein
MPRLFDKGDGFTTTEQLFDTVPKTVQKWEGK